MSLLAKLRGEEQPPLSVHDFDYVVRMNLTGAITDAQAIALLEKVLAERQSGTYTLTAGELAQLTEMSAAFTAQPTVQAKMGFLLNFAGAMEMYSRGHLSTAQVKTVLGITTD